MATLSTPNKHWKREKQRRKGKTYMLVVCLMFTLGHMLFKIDILSLFLSHIIQYI